MGFIFINGLPTPAKVWEQFPPALELVEIKHAQDEEIKKVFVGESSKLVVIIGPCSADNEEFVCDYAGRLVKIQEKTRDKLIVIPRVYTDKPRTIGEGYMGMIHQPDPEKRPDTFGKIPATRHMHIRVLRETGLSTADEMFYPENMSYLSDMISYMTADARSVENQSHRPVASGYGVPVGMKDPTSDNLTVMLNSAVAAQFPHDSILRGFEVQHPSSPLTHTILRGVINKRG